MNLSSRLRLLALTVSAPLWIAGGMSTAVAGENMATHVQIRGVVETLAGEQLTVTSHEGSRVNVNLSTTVGVSAVKKASIDDIKKGDYVGIASLPASHGQEGALEVLIFPAQLKGVGEGRFNYDLKPGSSMTNATVANAVKSVDHGEVTVTWHGHTKKIEIADDTPIVTLAPATKKDIQSGIPVFIPAEKDANGVLSTQMLIVGKNGVVPPM